MRAEETFGALIIDVGNTRVRVAGWSGEAQDPRLASGGGELAARSLAPVPTVKFLETPAKSGAKGFVQLMSALQGTHSELPVVVSGVVPDVVQMIQSVWPDAVIVDHTRALPFSLTLPEPAAIGPDRLCNMATAAALGLTRALVVDAGTATTFDLLVEGEFIGGLIAPGMALSAACLTDRTARLAAVPFAPCPLEPGRDTATAMQAGAFHTAKGGVDSVITELCQKYGPLPVIVTGGLAPMLGSDTRIVDIDWTVRGAVVLSGAC